MNVDASPNEKSTLIIVDLKYSPALNKSDDYCDNCNNKQDMYNTSDTTEKNPIARCNNQNYCYNVK